MLCSGPVAAAVGKAPEALLAAAGRVETMAHLDDKLHESDGFSGTLDAAHLPEDLLRDVADRYGDGGPTIGFRGDGVTIPGNASTPLGIIVNVLVTNATKHAFRAGPEEPRVEVSLGMEADGWARLTVTDNGAGVPGPVPAGTVDGFGLTLVRSFVEQLRGTLTILQGEGQRGTPVEVRFPGAGGQDSGR